MEREEAAGEQPGGARLTELLGQPTVSGSPESPCWQSDRTSPYVRPDLKALGLKGIALGGTRRGRRRAPIGKKPRCAALPLADGCRAVREPGRLKRGVRDARRLVVRGLEGDARGLTRDRVAVSALALGKPIAQRLLLAGGQNDKTLRGVHTGATHRSTARRHQGQPHNQRSRQPSHALNGTAVPQDVLRRVRDPWCAARDVRRGKGGAWARPGMRAAFAHVGGTLMPSAMVTEPAQARRRARGHSPRHRDRRPTWTRRAEGPRSRPSLTAQVPARPLPAWRGTRGGALRTPPRQRGTGRTMSPRRGSIVPGSRSGAPAASSPPRLDGPSRWRSLDRRSCRPPDLTAGGLGSVSDSATPPVTPQPDSLPTSGAKGDRTPDLRIANAALSQLSYCPDGVLPRRPVGSKRPGNGRAPYAPAPRSQAFTTARPRRRLRRVLLDRTPVTDTRRPGNARGGPNRRSRRTGAA